MSSNPEELHHLEIDSSWKMPTQIKPSHTMLDVQYCISKNFLKHISSSLFSQEIKIMDRSNKLLEQFQASKQLESTMDLTTSRSQISFNEIPECFARDRNNGRKLISRKSPKAIPGDFQLQLCLRDVEENCNSNTLNTFKNLIEDMKNMKKTIIQHQTNEKLNKPRKNNSQRLEQENLVLKQRVKELKQSMEELQKQKKDNSEIRSQKSQKDNRQLAKQMEEMKKFICDKEQLVKFKMQKVTEISERIEAVLQQQDADTACNKCCSFMKRIKDSLMRYRSYLQEKETQLDNLLNQYKGVVLASA